MSESRHLPFEQRSEDVTLSRFWENSMRGRCRNMHYQRVCLRKRFSTC